MLVFFTENMKYCEKCIVFSSQIISCPKSGAPKGNSSLLVTYCSQRSLD